MPGKWGGARRARPPLDPPMKDNIYTYSILITQPCIRVRHGFSVTFWEYRTLQKPVVPIAGKMPEWDCKQFTWHVLHIVQTWELNRWYVVVVA